MIKDVILRPGREKSVFHGHPWVFTSAIKDLPSQILPGDIVRVLDQKIGFLGYAFCNPKSRIALRILSRNESDFPNESFFSEKMSAAIGRRKIFNVTGHDSYRLFYSESDLIPGLIADKYGSFIVMQTLSAGAERFKSFFASALKEMTGASGVIERNDATVRGLEGLSPCSGVLTGAGMPADHVIEENGFRFYVNAEHGQKTGYYLDQKINRKIVGSYAKEKEILDCFSYSGSFAVHCLKGGARKVWRVDSSSSALERGTENLKLNDMDESLSPAVKANAFELLRTYREEGKQFDMIILDPPKLAPTKSQADKAMRAYKDVNMSAMKLLRPDGLLVTFSCSSGVSAEEFKTVTAWAASDAGRNVQIVERLGQPEDHPVLLSFPEGEYLKGLVLRVL